MPPQNSFVRNAPTLCCIFVVVLVLSLFFFQLGSKPFWDYDEALYANVIHDSIEHGNVLTLTSNGGLFTDKPPLSFWLGMGFDSVFHHPEFSYRLTAAIAGVVSVILVMLITYEVTSSWLYAALAGFILLTTGPFLQAGRELRLDVPATASVLFTVYAFLRGLKYPRWFLGMGVGLAIGFFFKHVIGFMSLPFLLCWSLVHKDFNWLKSKFTWLGGLLFLIIFLPWHIYQIVMHGKEFWQNYFLYNFFERFKTDLLQEGSYTTRDYLTFFFTYGAPWTILFGALLVWLTTQWRRFRTPEMKAILAPVLATVFLFLLFISLKTKILAYLVPVYPFVAITLAIACAHVFPKIQLRKGRTLTFVLIGSALSVFALWMSISYAFHGFSITAENDLIVGEEVAVAQIIKSDTRHLPLYAYQYYYYDTIVYYSGRKDIQVMKYGQELGKPFLLLVSKSYMDWHSFPKELAAHLSTEYEGQVLILYKFTP